MKKLITLSIALLLSYVVQAQFYNNGGTLSISTGGILQVNNTFTNKSGGNLVNNGTLNVKGNLTNEQTMSNPHNGTLHLNGSSPQTIGGTAALLVKHLTFNNAAGISLSKSLKADGEVKFQSGIVAASSSTEPLAFTSNGLVSATNAPSNTSHVNGYVLREGTGTFDFPVGDGTRYQKVGTNLTANGSGLLVKYNASDAGTGTFTTTGASTTALTSYNTQEHWDISPLSTATGAVTIHWDDYKTPTLTDISLVKVAHKNGSNWLNQGGTGTGSTSTGSVTSSNISTWSPFTLGLTSAVTSTPTITPTGTLTAFTTCAGTASTQQNFTVSGSNLTADITVTAPTGFEVSKTSGSGFGSSVTLTQSGGTVNSTTIYVRITATATGTPSGNVSLTSTDATTQNVAVSGTIKSYTLAISTPTNPTTCGGTDGKIAFTYGSGTIPDGTYSISYSLGGSTLSKNVTFGSTSGRISAEASTGLTAYLEGLGAGSYSGFQITINGCIITPTGTTPVSLSDPTAPTFTVGTAVKPTTCGGTNGSIPLTGLTASTNYSVSYQKDGAAATVGTLTSNASGVLTIGSLGAGNYTNITVTLGGCTSAAKSATLSNPSYTLAISTPTNPTTCGGTDGKIAFSYGSGTIPDGTYSMSYSLGGSTLSKNITFGSASGRISAEASTGLTAYLEGLGTGSYSNFQITINGCTVTPTGTTPVELSAPATPTFSVGTPTKPTTCGGTNGSIPLNGLANNTSYSVSYQKDGAAAVVQTLTTNASGVLTLSNLSAGSYTNITVTLGGCASAPGSTTLSDPSYTLAISTPTNPTTCGGTDGKIAFTYGSGTIPDGTYSISYSLGGSTLSKNVTFGSTSGRISAEASTGLTAYLEGLGTGSYSNFQITINGCTVTPTGTTPVELSAPATPTFSVGTPTKPTTCGGTNGSIPLNGLANNTSYSVSYQKDGAAAVVQTLSSNASGVLTLSNLGAGSYTNITVTLGGCTSAASSTTISNPSFTINIGSPTNPTTCGSSDGSIRFTSANVVPGTYPISYSKDMNTVTGTITFTSSIRVGVGAISSNMATLTGLGAGSYSNFKINVSGCDITPTGATPVELSAPATPTFSIGTTTHPTTCGSTNGSIPLNGLANNTSYSVSYQKDGAAAVVQTLSTNASGVLTIGSLGAGNYTNIIVTLDNCTSTSASVTLANPPSATASISGTTTVCQNAPNPLITFTGANGTAPYTFSYRINGGAVQTLTTSGSSISATLAQNTATAGVVNYSLVAVNDAQGCGQNQSGTATVTVQGKPTITLNTLQQTFNEGNNPVLCDTDANPVNGLQFTVSSSCVSGTPVWRVQVGSNGWSDWSTNPPISQSSNNQPHRYQAACDANCPVTYTSPIELTINYRSTAAQNVSMLVDGVMVAVGETKEVCSLVNMPLTFNANCATGEIILYSIDGGEYSASVPVALVDSQFHNYRVRCRKSDGTPSCVESESGVMRLKLVTIPSAPTVSLSSTSSCNLTASFSGQSTCGSLRTVWYNASTNVALPSLPSTVPSQTTSYYARCQTENGCVSEKSNVVTFSLTPTQVAPIVTASQEIVCTGTTVTISANCPAGSQTFWNMGVTAPSFEVAFNNVAKQTYWAKCIFEGGCQSAESTRKDIYWNAFVVTLINIGESKSAVKPANDKSLWSSQFITRDGGPELEQSTQVNPTIYYVENANKIAPRYWTINVETCNLGTNGSLTFDMQAVPEIGVIRSYNTHENNAPYFMYANREGWTELYAQNHPAYGFYQDNNAGGNVYDTGLPKGLYKLGIRYWDMKGWGSIYPSTRKSQGNVLAYQEYWFRIQSKDGVGIGAARVAESNQQSAVSEGVNNSFVIVLPNPVTNTLRLKVQDSKGQPVQTVLTDASGRQVVSRRFVPETNTHQEEFNVSELANGIYFLKVNADDKQATLKVVKVQ